MVWGGRREEGSGWGALNWDPSISENLSDHSLTCTSA